MKHKYDNLKDVSDLKEVFWINPKIKPYKESASAINIDIEAINDADIFKNG